MVPRTELAHSCHRGISRQVRKLPEARCFHQLRQLVFWGPKNPDPSKVANWSIPGTPLAIQVSPYQLQLEGLWGVLGGCFFCSTHGGYWWLGWWSLGFESLGTQKNPNPITDPWDWYIHLHGWLMFWLLVHVGKHTIHGSYGNPFHVRESYGSKEPKPPSKTIGLAELLVFRDCIWFKLVVSITPVMILWRWTMLIHLDRVF